MATLTFHDKKQTFTIQKNKNEGEWMVSILDQIKVASGQTYSFQEVKTDFEKELQNFELFWYSKPINTLRDYGLLLL